MSENIPNWAQKLMSDVGELVDDVTEIKKQTLQNCNKLDSMDGKLDSIVEIVTANGQGIEVISERVDKLEK